MLISTILAAHEDETLPRNERIINDLNVGDAFLYRHHPIYRNLRDCYWALGYRFDTQDFCYLFELPLFSLDRILEARRMPVRDTVSPLRDLTRRFPEAVFDDLSFDSSLAYPINHILHHSVHCVADRVTEEMIGSWDALGRGTLAVLRVLICESFGNAIDLLANIDAHRCGEEGRALFVMNNLVYKPAEECEPYAELIARAGLKAGLQIVALFYLFRNLLAESIDAEFLGEALKRFGIEHERVDELLPLFDRTSLTFGFLIATNTRYFRYLGFEFEDLLALYDFDLLEFAPELAGAFDVIADLIAYGNESAHLLMWSAEARPPLSNAAPSAQR
ncbi:MAG TPA: hypothetical protein VGQ36_21170 [Thermoanaerobaculia bacterium]|jgi:hypothetical protein|nr:hypothetical protein [Thermoanaerobaculia bacterium]